MTGSCVGNFQGYQDRILMLHWRCFQESVHKKHEEDFSLEVFFPLSSPRCTSLSLLNCFNQCIRNYQQLGALFANVRDFVRVYFLCLSYHFLFLSSRLQAHLSVEFLFSVINPWRCKACIGLLTGCWCGDYLPSCRFAAVEVLQSGLRPHVNNFHAVVQAVLERKRGRNINTQ